MYTQLEKWSLNNRALHATKQIIDDPQDQQLYAALQNRPAFSYSETECIAPIVFADLKGVNGNVDEYKAFLYDLREKLQGAGSQFVYLETALDKKFPPELLKAMQNAWAPFQREQDVPSRTLVEAFIKAEVLPLPKDKFMVNHLKNGLEKVLGYYKKQSDYRFFEVKNILFHTLYWYTKYAPSVLEDFDFTRKNPKVLLWGTIAKRELYFLLFLYNLGCDIVAVHTVEDPLLAKLMSEEEFVSSFAYTREIEIDAFPTERPAIKMETVAKQHSEELRETLHSDNSYCYKPWQFIDYSVRALTMKTTIDELTILGVEKAMVRQGWEAQSGRVSIPHLFAKVNGINTNQNNYWKMYNTLRNFPKANNVVGFPLERRNFKLFKNEYYRVLNTDHIVDPEKLMAAPFWPYMQYRNHIQKLIADKCADLCALKGLKRVPGTPVEMQKIEIFSRMLQLPTSILNMLSTYDYPSDVPKLIIFNNGSGPLLSLHDAVAIAFAAAAAIDIVIFNPSGHNDIEIYLEEGEIDIHHLEEVAFNMSPKTRSIMGKFF